MILQIMMQSNYKLVYIQNYTLDLTIFLQQLLELRIIFCIQLVNNISNLVIKFQLLKGNSLLFGYFFFL